MRRPYRLHTALVSLVVGVACTSTGRGEPAPADPSTPPVKPATSERTETPAPVATPGPAVTPAPPKSACGPARNLTNGEQLLAALSPEWPRPGVGVSPVSVDLTADVDLVASSVPIALPGYCSSRCRHDAQGVRCEGTGDPCRAPVRFRLNEAVPGIEVDGHTYAREGTTLKARAGSRFRLVQRVHEFHPETPYYDPVITVAPACDVPCKPEERRCPATALCVPTQGDSFCLLCDGLSRPECACRTAEGRPKAEGAECTFLSGDYFPTGSCTSGRCTTSR